MNMHFGLDGIGDNACIAYFALDWDAEETAEA
jgi:hypothetical protein